MNNIDQFLEVSGKLLSHLYDNFPRPIYIKTHELVGGSIDEEKLEICPKTRFGKYTIEWLTHEGFIRSSGGNFGFYDGCCLTLKGLVALDATPSTLDKGESVIQKVKSGLASGSMEAIKAAIGAGMTALIGVAS